MFGIATLERGTIRFSMVVKVANEAVTKYLAAGWSLVSFVGTFETYRQAKAAL